MSAVQNALNSHKKTLPYCYPAHNNQGGDFMGDDIANSVTCMGEEKTLYTIVFRKPDGKRPFQKSSSRWKNNIKIHFKEMCGSELNFLAFVNTETNFQVSKFT